MNKNLRKVITLAIPMLLSFLLNPAWAMDDKPYKGQLMAEKTVDRYTLRYTLMNLEERKEVMKGMEGMKMHGMSDSPDVTHHLTVYIQEKNGTPVSAKIDFSITHPDGTVFKTLTMGMHGGYGADVMFTAQGSYKIETKAVITGKTIHDEIIYKTE